MYPVDVPGNLVLIPISIRDGGQDAQAKLYAQCQGHAPGVIYMPYVIPEV